MRPEVESRVPWWSWFGAISGAGLGFIIANVPGLMVGAFAGNRIGAVRDAKGKSVAAVFNDLGGQQKAEVFALVDARKLRTYVHLYTDTACSCYEGFGFCALVFILPKYYHPLFYELYMPMIMNYVTGMFV